MTQARGMQLFYCGMDAALGLIGMALWIVVVVALASGVTYAVVKVFPGDDAKAKPQE
jgi:hypothetical protein